MFIFKGQVVANWIRMITAITPVSATSTEAAFKVVGDDTNPVIGTPAPGTQNPPRDQLSDLAGVIAA